jgi:hypothetical protein
MIHAACSQQMALSGAAAMLVGGYPVQKQN